MKRISKHIILSVKPFLVLGIGFLSFSCIETFDFEAETESFESALVIEATITDELKSQEIVLSRTFRLEDDGLTRESGATVKVVDDSNTEYLFRESEMLGTYVSTIAFAAQQDVNYTLHITTIDGKAYTSSPEKYTQQSKIDRLYAERGFKLNGEEGMFIYVDNNEPSGSSKHYR